MTTKELFIEEKPVKVIDEEPISSDLIVEPVVEQNQKKVKKPMTEERKKALIENLAKGRATAKKNREVKLKAKQLLKDKQVIDTKVAKEINKLNNKSIKPNKVIVEDKAVKEAFNSDYLELKRELMEIKNMLKSKTITEEKKKELLQDKKEVLVEIKEQKVDKVNTPIIVVPQPPLIKGFSTLNNRNKRKIRLGF